MKLNNLFLAQKSLFGNSSQSSIVKLFAQQQHSVAFNRDHEINQPVQSSSKHLETSDLDFNEETCHETADAGKSFQYEEFIICKSISNMSRNRNVSNKLIKLEPNNIYRNHALSIFHEHIVERSRQTNTGNVSFSLLHETVSFSRPTLYEYITLKEQSAVSSHYSIISLVPMLLEIGRHSQVLEAGTGSGSMTLFLSEYLGGTGLLHTFDIGEKKVSMAKQYFRSWKRSFDLSAGDGQRWPSNVKFGVRDLCTEELGADYHGFYDAIYLDMGQLDRAVPKAYKLLKTGGVLVMNALHLTQVINVLNVIRNEGLKLEHELVIEPSNRLWEIRKILKGTKSFPHLPNVHDDGGSLNWTCRLEDRFDEKYKRGGMYFNYWSGFLVKLRKKF